MHAVVARSTFPSQNALNNTKHTMFGPLLEVVVVVGIGRQPAPHRSEVVKTPLLPSSGAVTPHMTGETGQQPNLKMECRDHDQG